VLFPENSFTDGRFADGNENFTDKDYFINAIKKRNSLRKKIQISSTARRFS
jgi:hypothetical protein